MIAVKAGEIIRVDTTIRNPTSRQVKGALLGKIDLTGTTSTGGRFFDSIDIEFDQANADNVRAGFVIPPKDSVTLTMFSNPWLSDVTLGEYDIRWTIEFDGMMEEVLTERAINFVQVDLLSDVRYRITSNISQRADIPEATGRIKQLTGATRSSEFVIHSLGPNVIDFSKGDIEFSIPSTFRSKPSTPITVQGGQQIASDLILKNTVGRDDVFNIRGVIVPSRTNNVSDFFWKITNSPIRDYEVFIPQNAFWDISMLTRPVPSGASGIFDVIWTVTSEKTGLTQTVRDRSVIRI